MPSNTRTGNILTNTKPETVSFKGGKTYTLDEKGFLNPPQQWDDEFAEGMAEMQGIYGGLTSKHWDFIRYLRKKFIEEKSVPVVVIACADNNLRLSNLRFLFPTGYHRGACRIAGINYNFMYKSNYWLTYETSTIPRVEYKLTPQGFLEDFEQWNERFAQLIVREWKLSSGLISRHLDIIAFLRDFYRKTGSIPTVYETCKRNNIDLEELSQLFPEGYRRGACRIAGLPFFG